MGDNSFRGQAIYHNLDEKRIADGEDTQSMTLIPTLTLNAFRRLPSSSCHNF